jgi:hypothetical protein
MIILATIERTVEERATTYFKEYFDIRGRGRGRGKERGLRERVNILQRAVGLSEGIAAELLSTRNPKRYSFSGVARIFCGCNIRPSS